MAYSQLKMETKLPSAVHRNSKKHLTKIGGLHTLLKWATMIKTTLLHNLPRTMETTLDSHQSQDA